DLEPSEEPAVVQDLPQPILVFWDLDNKLLPRYVSLASAVTTLEDFLHARPQVVQLYASYKSVRIREEQDYHLLESALAGAWSQNLKDSMKSFPELFPYGARIQLSQEAAEVPSSASVTITPMQSQAADCLLTRDLLRMVVPTSSDASCGTVCIISDDSDFGKVILNAHQCGWKVAVASRPNSWTLRSRSDVWIDWAELAEKMASQDAAGGPGYTLEVLESLRANVDISAHAIANDDTRIRRDMKRDMKRDASSRRNFRRKSR
ncbi:unnamed protein product, partial [Symbiodinium pilosum]